MGNGARGRREHNRQVVEDIQLEHDRPIWMLPGEWWESPKPISELKNIARRLREWDPDPQWDAQYDTPILLYDHRRIARYWRPALEDDWLASVYNQEGEEGERGESIRHCYRQNSSVKILPRIAILPRQSFVSASEYLKWLWRGLPKRPQRLTGNWNIHQISRSDFPTRMTATPRGLSVDIGYNIMHNIMLNNIALEHLDYAIEVEEMIRGGKRLEQNGDPIRRHEYERQLRASAARLIVQEQGERNVEQKVIPLWPLLTAEEVSQHYPNFNNKMQQQSIYGDEMLLPFRYNNTFTKGEQRPTFTHVSTTELKRYRQLCQLDPYKYESVCDKSILPGEELEEEVIRKTHEIFQSELRILRRVRDQQTWSRKYKLTADEMLYLGFQGDQTALMLPVLEEGRNLLKSPQWPRGSQYYQRERENISEDNDPTII